MRYIETSADGLTRTLIDPSDPTRQQTLSAGASEAAYKSACDAFFGPEVAEVPTEVLSAKFKYVLAEDGLLEQADALVAQSPPTTRVRWTYPSFYRTDVLLNQMVGVFAIFAGITIDLDAYFRRAKAAD